jgi:hypothetical protein
MFFFAFLKKNSESVAGFKKHFNFQALFCSTPIKQSAMCFLDFIFFSLKKYRIAIFVVFVLLLSQLIFGNILFCQDKAGNEQTKKYFSIFCERYQNLFLIAALLNLSTKKC